MRKSAFTLIELLVVVAIIAILIAIILPVVNRMRGGGGPTTSDKPVYESPTTTGPRSVTNSHGQSSEQRIVLLPGQKLVRLEWKQGVPTPITEERKPDDQPKTHRLEENGIKFVIVEK